jgi:hypothetical protein
MPFRIAFSWSTENKLATLLTNLDLQKFDVKLSRSFMYEKEHLFRSV